ncbi:MAG TPA: DUF4386 domain-containing protein [Steroidobacteraceae bacterium]
MTSRKHQARVAGVLYALLVVIGLIGLMYLPAFFIVRGDAAATAKNILASELLYRTWVTVDMAGNILFVFVVLALYQLLKEVNRVHATLMMVLALVSVPLSLVNTVAMTAPLVLLSGADFLAPLDQHQLEALAYAFLRLRGQGIVVASVFWGLWLLPFGLLVYRSGFIPRIIGVLLWVAGIGYVLDCLVSLLAPANTALSPVLRVLEAGELPIVLWLLIVGAKDPLSGGRAPTQAA